jgi:hypothetical protein|tara:strand:- start:837 stop:1046 length:210 start_codon:yes stop_codon:yes gene_type:complete
MPIKFKQSATVKDRATGKVKTEHYYIKSMAQEELITELNNSSTKPKVKQKVRNELDRRGVKIQWVSKVV